jgi:capsular polysaccharide biosynthesis protein
VRSIAGRDEPIATTPGGFNPWPLLRPLLASWPLLVVGLLVGPAIVSIMQSRAPVMYSAEALVAPNRTRTQVQFVPQIKTIDDNSAAGGSALTPERRQALVDLVHSSNVEAQVLADLNGKLSTDSLQRGQLSQQVSGTIRPRSEILSIQAVAAAPSDSMLIVNAWAKNYVDEVNKLYSSSGGDGSIGRLRDEAQQTLEAAQTTLSTSIATSQLESLTEQITQRQALLTLLQSPYQTASATGDTKSGSGDSTSSASTSNPSLNDYRLAERRTLDDLAQTLRRVDATRQNVRALVSQAQTSGNGNASDAAALALLKTQLVAISDGLPSQIQLQLPTGLSGGSATDLLALAASLDAARAELQNQFETRRAGYEQKNAQDITDLELQLQDLRAKREGADAERKRLTAARDLASDTYTALAKKAEEQRVTNSTAGHEVELASEATYAGQLPKQATSSLVAAALIGLLITIAIAYLRWYALGRGRSFDTIRLRPSPSPRSEHSVTH